MEKMISDDQTIEDLEKQGFKFKLTFYKNDIIKYEKNGRIYVERFLSRNLSARNRIEIKPINAEKFDKPQVFVGLSNTKMVKKIRTDILGNYYECEQEKFSLICK